MTAVNISLDHWVYASGILDVSHVLTNFFSQQYKVGIIIKYSVVVSLWTL